MATYAELFELRGDRTLRNRITVAVIVAAEAIRANAGSETATRLAWAKAAFENPVSAAASMLMAVLAANKDATVAAIQGADDATLQTNVADAVDIFTE